MSWRKGERPSRRRWAKVRLAVLDRDSWCCQKCGNYGNEADHIKRLEDGGAVYDESNLQTLCRGCHITKTGDERRGKAADPEVAKWRRYLLDKLPAIVYGIH